MRGVKSQTFAIRRTSVGPTLGGRLQQFDGFHDRLVLETLEALDRNLEDLRCLQDDPQRDPVALARIAYAKSLLARAKSLALKLNEQAARPQ